MVISIGGYWLDFGPLDFREDLDEVFTHYGIISRRRLVEFWELHPEAEQPLRAWYAEAKKASWKSPVEIKATYRSVCILPTNRVVFNIKGNTYRLVVIVEYSQGKMFVRFVGIHAEYDRIDATPI